ncbi:MAG TPA: HlyD family efflux transporter periplasmic adaptor subunit [Bryobacteraceae bacterium]|nr:HlyD family efflux transporter periplasmic adaptor subunit [Bryobacteraceae bacterium]
MTRTYILLGLLAMLGGASLFFLPRGVSRGSPPSPRPSASDSGGEAVEGRIAAPGVVEAASDEIAVRAEIPGRLTSVAVEEGGHVARHQVVATQNDSLARTRVEAAEAEVKLRQAELTAVLNGANQLQRREVWVHMKEAEAALAQARAEYERRQKLFAQGALPREEVERAAAELEVSQERVEEATLHRQMIGAPAIDTDREHAEAALAAAKANLDEARALIAKATIRAPLAGIVVHRFLQPGELASEASGPILTIADLAKLRVRAEIDEADIGAICLGEKAYVTAPAYGDRRFGGQVVRIASALGRKKVSTGDPSERVDTKVLETLIELDPGTSLPLGLQVTCYLTPVR